MSFDKNHQPKIYLITEDGSSINATNFSVVSTGSGSVFSQIYFDQLNYDISITEIEGLFFAYKAKKWAEAPTGVGIKTDIILFRKNGSKLEIYDNDPLMNKLNTAHLKEVENINKTRKGLLTKLIKDSGGKLK